MTEYVLAPRKLVEIMRDETLDPGRRLELETILDGSVSSAEVVTPPWPKVRAMAGHLARMIGERGATATAELDQLRATMRDELDVLEVSLRDEWALYHGLVWVGMVVELARHGYKNGAIGVETLESVKEIATTIASALLEFLPPEARG